MKLQPYKLASSLLAVVAGLFVINCTIFFHKPEVPEELLKKFS
jgi:cyclic lactone autoinducer peptide